MGSIITKDICLNIDARKMYNLKIYNFYFKFILKRQFILYELLGNIDEIKFVFSFSVFSL